MALWVAREVTPGDFDSKIRVRLFSAEKGKLLADAIVYVNDVQWITGSRKLRTALEAAAVAFACDAEMTFCARKAVAYYGLWSVEATAKTYEQAAWLPKGLLK